MQPTDLGLINDKQAVVVQAAATVRTVTRCSLSSTDKSTMASSITSSSNSATWICVVANHKQRIAVLTIIDSKQSKFQSRNSSKRRSTHSNLSALTVVKTLFGQARMKSIIRRMQD